MCAASQVTLVAHSAGGWLARAFLAAEQHFDESEAHAAGTRHNRCGARAVGRACFPARGALAPKRGDVLPEGEAAPAPTTCREQRLLRHNTAQ